MILKVLLKIVLIENVSGKKSEYSLGNHGIGKNAVFRYSSIQTVFYSSLNQKGERKFKGVSKLGTFEYENEKKQERIYYGNFENGKVKLVSDPEIFLSHSEENQASVSSF